jgi:hypothetical protein
MFSPFVDEATFIDLIHFINKLAQCLLTGMQMGQILIGLAFSLVAQP